MIHPTKAIDAPLAYTGATSQSTARAAAALTAYQAKTDAPAGTDMSAADWSNLPKADPKQAGKAWICCGVLMVSHGI